MIESFDHLTKCVPEAWRGVTIGIGNSLEHFSPIMRISLHEHADGRRVVLIHATPLENVPRQAAQAKGKRNEPD